MTKDHKRGAVLTPQDATLLKPIQDTDYLITILRFKRFFGAIIIDVIPPITDAPPVVQRPEPRKAPMSQIGMSKEEPGA